MRFAWAIVEGQEVPDGIRELFEDLRNEVCGVAVGQEAHVHRLLNLLAHMEVRLQRAELACSILLGNSHALYDSTRLAEACIDKVNATKGYAPTLIEGYVKFHEELQAQAFTSLGQAKTATAEELADATQEPGD